MDPSIKPSFAETGLRSVITEFALELAAQLDDEWYPSGTAVVIGPYLAITAKHVFEDYWARFEGNLSGEDIQGSFVMWAFQGLNNGEKGAMWNVTKIWPSPHTDIAFLKLTPSQYTPSDHKWRIVAMNLMPPAIGSRVDCFGYHSPEIITQEQSDRIEVRWKSSPTTSIGEVIEIYHTQRDRVKLPFPCYMINARFEGGMSGGPVFNDAGELCGIISTTTKLLDGENGYISYVASLWPSMGTLLNFDRDSFPPGIKYPALELAKHGHITARNWQKVAYLDETRQVSLTVDISPSA